MHPINYLVVCLGLGLLAYVLCAYREDYKKKRRKARLCKHRLRYVDPLHPEIKYPFEQCGCETVRVYEMTRCPGALEETWWLKCYTFKIDDVCMGEKRHVTPIYDGTKLYSRWQILWRRLTNRSQFDPGSTDESKAEVRAVEPSTKHLNAY